MIDMDQLERKILTLNPFSLQFWHKNGYPTLSEREFQDRIM